MSQNQSFSQPYFASSLDAVEELHMNEHLPFECYTDGASNSQSFATISEMSRAMGVDVQTIQDAMRYNHGKFGAFMFIER